MEFYHYFSVLICSVFLVLNTFNAQANAIKLSILHEDNPCPNVSTGSESSLGTDGVLDCFVAKPYAGNFTLTCKPDSQLLSNLTLAWFKGTTPLKPVDKRIEIHGGDQLSLNFISVIPEDTDRYMCQAVRKGENVSVTPDSIASIEMRVLPYVKNAHKDVTAIEDNVLNLTCAVISVVPTNITWLVSTSEGNETYTESRGRINLIRDGNVTNAILSVKQANITTARGTYVCIAESNVGHSLTNSTFFVKIKSKYAALWPFLGICAEVIILCTIILIYEKKRDKTELEESDTDQGPETKSSPDHHGQDSVRYRK